MNTQTLISCGLIGLLGVLFQVLVKIQSLKARAKVGNVSFSVTGYFKDDYPTILLSITVVIGAILAIDEILNLQPKVAEYIKLLFFFVGYTGSSLINVILSRTEQRIMKVIDSKTDIADGRT